MSLIKTIAEVKAVLRVSSLDEDGALPDIENAAEIYIRPAIGADLYEYLVEKYDAEELDDEEKKLVKKIQKPLAAFAYLEDIAAMHLKISDGGVRRMTTDNMPAAYSWEFEAVKDYLATRAYQGMESLFEYLEKNKEDFALWTESDAYKIRHRFCIRSGYDFSSCYTLAQPLRTFNALIPKMAFVEEFYIEKSIGKTFFVELKSKDAPTEDEKEALRLLKHIVANYTIRHAAESLPVRISEAGFTVNAAITMAAADNNREKAPDNQMDLLIKSCEREGETYTKALLELLNSKASAEIFPTYFASAFYSAPPTVAEKVDRNANRKNLFL